MSSINTGGRLSQTDIRPLEGDAEHDAAVKLHLTNEGHPLSLEQAKPSTSPAANRVELAPSTPQQPPSRASDERSARAQVLEDFGGLVGDLMAFQEPKGIHSFAVASKENYANLGPSLRQENDAHRVLAAVIAKANQEPFPYLEIRQENTGNWRESATFLLQGGLLGPSFSAYREDFAYCEKLLGDPQLPMLTCHDKVRNFLWKYVDHLGPDEAYELRTTDMKIPVAPERVKEILIAAKSAILDRAFSIMCVRESRQLNRECPARDGTNNF